MSAVDEQLCRTVNLCKDLPPAFEVLRPAMPSDSDSGDRWSRLPELAQIGLILLVAAGITLVLSVAAHLRTDTAVALGLGAIGISALVYANHQFRDAQHTLRNLDMLTTDLIDLKSQLSTERLQPFPNFIAQIVGLLERATTKIEIFCDYPTYGMWSDPEAYRRYADAIDATSANVRLVCLNEWRRTQLAQERLAREGFDRMGRDQMHHFLAAYQCYGGSLRPSLSPESMTGEQFLAILEESNKRALERQFIAGDERQTWETDLFMPLFFWIVDDTEAVFALAPHMAPTTHELGFRTRDELLIRALQGIFKGYVRVRSGTEKRDENRIGIVSFAAGRAEWQALVRSSADCEREAVRLRAEIEKYVTTTASGGGDVTVDSFLN